MMGSQPATGRGTRATTVNRNHQPRLAIIVTVTMSEHSPGCLHLASGDTLYCARPESGDHSHVDRTRHARTRARRTDHGSVVCDLLCPDRRLTTCQEGSLSTGQAYRQTLMLSARATCLPGKGVTMKLRIIAFAGHPNSHTIKAIAMPVAIRIIAIGSRQASLITPLGTTPPRSSPSTRLVTKTAICTAWVN